MTPEKWKEVSEIFHAAFSLDSAARQAYLDDVCSDPSIRKEVESLIAASSEAADFISEPAFNRAAVAEITSDAASLSGAFVGHYRIENTIGSGGMGEVYLATDSRLNRRVAIKRLPYPYSTDPVFLKRFRNEAQAAAMLNHPNVATIYSVEEFNGKPFITMEYVQGQTLDSLTPSTGLNIRVFLDWFVQLAGALQHAHERGITHRDIKPGNIMISADGTPKILDFGLAMRAAEKTAGSPSISTVTQPGQILGTPSYMSPEQAEGKDVDHRTDIFSLGVVMYEAITGKRPFTGDSHAEVLSNLLKTDPPPVSDLRSDIPFLITRVIGRCLAKRPRDRFQSMQEVRTILAETKAALDAGKSADSLGRRLYLETRSDRLVWRPAALLLVVLVAVGLWYYFSSESAATPPISFDKMTMKRLSQTNNVAYASISPDGKSVLFVTMEDNGDRALWLRRVSDANAIQIVAPQPVRYWDCPFFSEDGEYIYYITAGRSATHGTLYRVSSLGGHPRKLIDKTNHLGTVSPDGKRLLFVRYGDTNPNASANTTESRILSANVADGGDEQVIRTATGETILREPRYSADGETIFYVKRELVDGVEYWSLMSMPAGGGRETRIVRQRNRIGEVAVLRNLPGLLVNAGDPVSNLHQIYYVALPDGRMTRLTNDLNHYVGVSVDREGKNIVSAQRSDENSVWVGEAHDLSTLRPLTKAATAYQTVDWTPDGRIVYDTYENNRAHIWISDADGQNALQLTGPESDGSQPKVSGDGRYIAFNSRRSGFNQIWRMDIDGTNPVLLADVPGIAQHPKFEADGRTVVFRWYNEGSAPLARVSILGGPVQGISGLPPAIVYNWAMSPDGRQVAYSANDGTSGRMHVLVKDIERSDAGPITLDIWPSSIFKWMPDGKGILYQESLRGDSPQSRVFQIDPQRPQPKLLLSTEPDTLRDMTYSRDGKRVAIVRGKTTSDAVMMSVAAED